MKKFFFLILIFSQLFSCFAGDSRKRGTGNWKDAAASATTASFSEDGKRSDDLLLVKKNAPNERVLLPEKIIDERGLLPNFITQSSTATIIAWPHEIAIEYTAPDGQPKKTLLRTDTYKDIVFNNGQLGLLFDTNLCFYNLSNSCAKTEFEPTNGNHLIALCPDKHNKGFLIVLKNNKKISNLQQITEKLDLGKNHPLGEKSIKKIEQVLPDQIVLMDEENNVTILNNNFENLTEILLGIEPILPLYFLTKNHETESIATKNKTNENLLISLKKTCHEGQAGALVSSTATAVLGLIKGVVGMEDQETTKIQDLHEEIRKTLNADGIPNNLNDLFVGSFEMGDHLIFAVIKNSKNQTVLKFVPVDKATKELIKEEMLPKKEYYKLLINFDKNGKAFVTSETNKTKIFVGKTMNSETLLELYKNGITQ